MEDSAFDKPNRDSFHSIVMSKFCVEGIEAENTLLEIF